jgi:HEAT repeat protein
MLGLQDRRPDVEKLRSRGDLPALQRALSYRDVLLDRDDRAWDVGARIRVRAVEALSDFYGAGVASALTPVLEDRDERVRLAAIRGLAALNSPQAAEALLGALAGSPWFQRPDDRPLRDQALDVLVAMDVDLLPERFVLRVLNTTDGAPTHGDQQALDRLLAADERGTAATQAVVHLLVARLADPDPDRRRIAEELLGGLVPQSVEQLIACLDRDPERLPAARLLAVSGAGTAVEPLVHLLGDDSSEARRTAASALGELKDTRAVQPLLRATGDDDLSVREAAIAALDAMGVAAIAVGLATLLKPMLGDGADEQAIDAAAEHVLPWAQRVLARLPDPGR